MRHCVGSYAENAVAKKTVILFVRLKKNRNTPFYTMEIQNGDIRQCRGKRNKAMTVSVKQFIESFQQKLLDGNEKRKAV